MLPPPLIPGQLPLAPYHLNPISATCYHLNHDNHSIRSLPLSGSPFSHPPSPVPPLQVDHSPSFPALVYVIYIDVAHQAQ